MKLSFIKNKFEWIFHFSDGLRFESLIWIRFVTTERKKFPFRLGSFPIFSFNFWKTLSETLKDTNRVSCCSLSINFGIPFFCAQVYVQDALFERTLVFLWLKNAWIARQELDSQKVNKLTNSYLGKVRYYFPAGIFDISGPALCVYTMQVPAKKNNFIANYNPPQFYNFLCTYALSSFKIKIFRSLNQYISIF